MVKVFVSGCYDILHAGHIQFFKDAKSLGDYLVVCFASDKVLEIYKGRKSSIPEDNKKILLSELRCVDKVLKSSDVDPVFDFRRHILREKPDILAVTEDDKHKSEKAEFCRKHKIRFVVLPKTNPAKRVSTTKIISSIKGTKSVPLRVDFAGGWLDVPRFSAKGGFIVNCAIQPKVSLDHWPYEIGSGLGGSAAYAILKAEDSVKKELNAGVGWQDPAVITETGLCVWKSGRRPVLEIKRNPFWLRGKMLIYWLGKGHYTPDLADKERDYNLIKKASIVARNAVMESDFDMLCKAVNLSYNAQIKEGMEKLPNIKNSSAKKYLGGGYGGYALYLFGNKKLRDKAASENKKAKPVEPYIKSV